MGKVKVTVFTLFFLFPGVEVAMAADPQAPASVWEGVHAGLNIGYASNNPGTVSGGDYDTGDVIGARLPTGALWSYASPNMAGVQGGGEIGIDWNLRGTDVVVGAVADFQGLSLSGISTGVGSPGVGNYAGYFPFLTTEQKLDWYGTVRGRLGYAVVPDILLYATAGFAYGRGADRLTSVGSDLLELGSASAGNIGTGWAAGGGIEWAFARNWSLKAEYLFMSLSNAQAGSGGSGYLWTPLACTCSGRFDGFFSGQTGAPRQFQTVRLGLNYRFNASDLAALALQ